MEVIKLSVKNPGGECFFLPAGLHQLLTNSADTTETSESEMFCFYCLTAVDLHLYLKPRGEMTRVSNVSAPPEHPAAASNRTSASSRLRESRRRPDCLGVSATQYEREMRFGHVSSGGQIQIQIQEPQIIDRRRKQIHRPE